MDNLYETIMNLCEEKGVTAGRMCSDLNISRGMITDLKMGRKKTLSIETLSKMASYFEVSIDFLLGKQTETKMPALTAKDERDISKKLEEALSQLESSQEGLMFQGEPLDDATKELIAISLRNSLEMGKKLAKQKFTPKKYKGEQ